MLPRPALLEPTPVQQTQDKEHPIPVPLAHLPEVTEYVRFHGQTGTVQRLTEVPVPDQRGFNINILQLQVMSGGVLHGKQVVRLSIVRLQREPAVVVNNRKDQQKDVRQDPTTVMSMAPLSMWVVPVPVHVPAAAVVVAVSVPIPEPVPVIQVTMPM